MAEVHNGSPKSQALAIKLGYNLATKYDISWTCIYLLKNKQNNNIKWHLALCGDIATKCKVWFLITAKENHPIILTNYFLENEIMQVYVTIRNKITFFVILRGFLRQFTTLLGNLSCRYFHIFN